MGAAVSRSGEVPSIGSGRSVCAVLYGLEPRLVVAKTGVIVTSFSTFIMESYICHLFE